MKLTLKVDMGEGPFHVTTNLQTMVAWERRFKRKASEMANGIGYEDIAFMAWESCKQAKIVVPVEFDTFISRLVDIELVSEQQSVPFDQAPTDVR